MPSKRQLTTLLVQVWLAAAALGCGQVKDLIGGKTPDSPADANPYPVAPAAPLGLSATPAAKAAAPLITRLVDGTIIPAHVKATSLRIAVVANDPSASFDCQVGGQWTWVPCNAGAGYDFGRLAHSMSYSVAIRARGTDGRVDAHPLLVTFYSDMDDGIAPTIPGVVQSLAAKVTLPTSVADLPVLVKPTTPAAVANHSRFLQVGAYYAMTVPGTALVSGFATDKTYNGVLHTMLLMPGGGSIIANNGICTASYQRPVTAADGSLYCDATPSSADQLAAGAASLPRNFIELNLAPGAGRHEALLVAAVDGTGSEADADPAVERLTITSRCQGAVAAGRSPLPLVNQFYAGSAQMQTLVWCQTTSAAGRSQWLGMVKAALTADQAGPSLRIIYAIDASQALVTSTQFIERVTQALRLQLTPIAPLTPSA